MATKPGVHRLPALTRRHEPAGSQTWGQGRGGRPWRRLRAQILLRDLYTCQECGLVSERLEVDHTVPVSQGGTDDPSNLRAMCSPCHRVKTAREGGRR